MGWLFRYLAVGTDLYRNYISSYSMRRMIGWLVRILAVVGMLYPIIYLITPTRWKESLLVSVFIYFLVILPLSLSLWKEANK